MWIYIDKKPITHTWNNISLNACIDFSVLCFCHDFIFVLCIHNADFYWNLKYDRETVCQTLQLRIHIGVKTSRFLLKWMKRVYMALKTDVVSHNKWEEFMNSHRSLNFRRWAKIFEVPYFPLIVMQGD